MARGATVALGVRTRLAAQVAQMLVTGDNLHDEHKTLVADFMQVADTPALNLEASFDVWMVPLDGIRDERSSVSRIAIATDRWHHQVVAADGAVAYARSTHEQRHEPSTLTGIFVSPMAQSIEDAITWIDANVKDSAVLVRLLVAPACYVSALWLLATDAASDRLIIVSAPESFPIDAPTPITPDAYLTILRSLAPR